MKKTKYLLIFVLPLIFAGGCIDGQAVLSINKDGSGKITLESLFDIPAYSAVVGMDYTAAETFFLEQLKKTLTNDAFEAWNGVTWKFLDDGRCYFKGTAYFKDINKAEFFIDSIKSGLKLLYLSGQQEKPVLELRCSAKEAVPENQQTSSLPPALFETFRISLVVTLPADIEKAENFQLLDTQTAMLVIQGRDLTASGSMGTLVLTSSGKDLFDYQTEVQKAQNVFNKILKNIQRAQTAQNAADWLGKDEQRPEDNNNKPAAAKSDLKNDLNAQLRQGLGAEMQNDFNKALEIYKNIADDTSADEKYKAAASYQTGVCLLKMGDKEKAAAQFEDVIKNYPLQRSAALKSVKMLREVHSGKTAEKQQQEQPPVVVSTTPGLFLEDVNSAVSAVTIIFSQAMKETDWFYSSFAPALLPNPAGRPFFDQTGCEWTLPVKLEPGEIYAVAVNYGGSEISNLKSQISNIQAGFRSVSGLKAEPFVLVFATADKKGEATLIDDKLIEKCEKINFEP